MNLQNYCRIDTRVAAAYAAPMLDLLDDLQHDLGKHLRLPLAMLAPDCTKAELYAALQDALLRTRHGAHGAQSAEMLWQQFLEAAGPTYDGYPHARHLRTCVASALIWRHASADELQRSEIESDFLALAQAIRQMRAEVQADG